MTNFIAIPLFFISFITASIRGEQCTVCTGFDDTRTIDMEELGLLGGSGAVTNCADLKEVIPLIDMATNSTECSLYNIISYEYCGCDNPPMEGCYVCADGTPLPDMDLVPVIMDITYDGMTCGEMAYNTSVSAIFLTLMMDAFGDMGDLFFDDMGAAVDGEGIEEAPEEEMDLPDIDLAGMMCGMVGGSCGCQVTTACKICENGLKNPDFVPETDDDSSFTCASGVAMFEYMFDASGLSCDEAKKEVASSGCECIEIDISEPTTPDSGSLDTNVPAPDESESTSGSSDPNTSDSETFDNSETSISHAPVISKLGVAPIAVMISAFTILFRG